MDDSITIPKSSVGKKKTVEEIYQKKSQLEHILLRPDTYIGSTSLDSQQQWVWDEAKKSMVKREVTYSPGLYKIFDEILVNAADNKVRDPTMNAIKINIDRENNTISVWNNGRGIPIVVHKEHKIYVPSLIFGHLLTSSNFNDEEKKITGGRNGYGAKLCNIFSTSFILETASSSEGLKFKQSWRSNMGTVNDPVITGHTGSDYTCITFSPDLARFKITCLDEDIVALFQRRAYDVAGTTRGVKVYLNGKVIPIKSFKEYVNLYLASGNEDSESPDTTADPEYDDDNSNEAKKKLDPALQKMAYENVSDWWEICVAPNTVSPGFQQISFVNSIATTKGGTHINHTLDPIVDKLLADAAKKIKDKNLKLTAAHVKQHIFIFVNCKIENPSFDSQTKENMTLNAKKFGSICEPSAKFLKECSALICDTLVEWYDRKTLLDLSKKGVKTKLAKVRGISKLEDANDAGTKNSPMCTLILTEGDSAKTLAVAGMSVVGRDHFGVYPLKGKILNVREASAHAMKENTEIMDLVKILGLDFTKQYRSPEEIKTLRYGRVMIMADQDQDGSHIKALIVNFFHYKWPNLVRNDQFLQQFITPIIKATRSGSSHSFYSLPEYESWRETLPESQKTSWKIKYYKGLGTSTSIEAKEYFSDMVRHRLKFCYSGPPCDDAIALAFAKDRIPDRKNWVQNHMEEKKRRRLLGLPEQYLYHKGVESITYKNFIDQELVLFSNSNNERSIPSLVDGLKPGQRKVLFTCFKRNDKREVKVAQLAGSVAELSAYHHGEASLASTIVNLAQDFVGSNNINLLQPLGQFGTRAHGGKDSASPRYIFTLLSPVTRAIFPADDDFVLRYNVEDNQVVEPEWYCPIIPMVLVNGAEGIGTGYGTKIPNHNPREIVRCLKILIESGDVNTELPALNPWYKNYNGSIMNLGNHRYLSVGNAAVLEDDPKCLIIDELPIYCWTQNYKTDVLEKMMSKEPGTASKYQVVDFREQHSDTEVRFMVSLDKEIDESVQDTVIETLKLTSSIATSNMVLFDAYGSLRSFESSVEILKEFYTVRLEKYKERKEYMLEKLQAEAARLSNQARFIAERLENKLLIEKKTKAQSVKLLQDAGYSSDPVAQWKSKRTIKTTLPTTATEDDDAMGDQSDSVPGAEKSADDSQEKSYGYLLGMTFWSLTFEHIKQLNDQRDKKLSELEELRQKTIQTLWIDELDNFLQVLDADEERRRKEQEKYARGDGKSSGSGSGKGGKKHKRMASTIADQLSRSFMESAKVRPLSLSADAIQSKKAKASGTTVKKRTKTDPKESDDLLSGAEASTVSKSSDKPKKPRATSTKTAKKKDISPVKKKPATKKILDMDIDSPVKRKASPVIEARDDFSFSDDDFGAPVLAATSKPVTKRKLAPSTQTTLSDLLVPSKSVPKKPVKKLRVEDSDSDIEVIENTDIPSSPIARTARRAATAAKPKIISDLSSDDEVVESDPTDDEDFPSYHRVTSDESD